MTLQELVDLLKKVPGVIDVNINDNLDTVHVTTDVILDCCHSEFDQKKRDDFETAVQEIIKQPMENGIIDSFEYHQQA